MTREMNFWDCPYHDYEETWDGQTEERFYRCYHPNRPDGFCEIMATAYGGKEPCSRLPQEPVDLDLYVNDHPPGMVDRG